MMDCKHERMYYGPSGVHIYDTTCPDCGQDFIIKKRIINDPPPITPRDPGDETDYVDSNR